MRDGKDCIVYLNLLCEGMPLQERNAAFPVTSGMPLCGLSHLQIGW